jgi:putative ABC transport system permease protein
VEPVETWILIFQKTYQLEIIAARDFQPGNTADSSSMILNEAALMALNKPVDKVIGSTVRKTSLIRQEYLKLSGLLRIFLSGPPCTRHIEPLIIKTPISHYIDRIGLH